MMSTGRSTVKAGSINAVQGNEIRGYVCGDEKQGTGGEWQAEDNERNRGAKRKEKTPL